MSAPGAVVIPAAVGGHLPRHRGDGLAEPACDGGEGLVGPKAQADLLPVGQGEPPRSWLPTVRSHWTLRLAANNGTDDLVRATDLAADLP